MKKLFIFAALFASCASTSPVIQKQDTVVRVVYRHDTTSVVVRRVDTLPVAVNWDTAQHSIHLTPSGSDDYPQIQAAINYCLSHAIPDLYLYGFFRTSHTLVIADTTGHRFHNVTLHIHGASWAKNEVDGYNTLIYPTFTNGPVFAVQQGKGVIFENLEGWGQYHRADTLSQLSIDTLTFNQWSDGECSDGPTDSHCFVVFDPFGDSTLFGGRYRMYANLHPWYMPTGLSGSTACKVQGCYIRNFIAGVVISGGPNQNGEDIDVDDNQFINCRSAYGCGNAQNKGNTFNNNMAWGQIRHIIDGVHLGFPHGDGATPPFVTGMNIAGYVYDYIECTTRAFSSNNKDVYGEGLFKLGFTGPNTSRGAGAAFTDCQIDFQNGGPSPAELFSGAGTVFKNNILRMYNDGKGPRRLVFNGVGMRIEDGTMSAPPIVVQGQAQSPMTLLTNVGMFYDYSLGSTLSRNDYDSITAPRQVLLRVDRSTFTGYFVTPDTAGLRPYMPILTAALMPIDSASNYAPATPVLNSQTIVGVISSISGNTVNVINIGEHMRDSTMIMISKCLYKTKL